jgi:phosphatidate cytidylyltransferase
VSQATTPSSGGPLGAPAAARDRVVHPRPPSAHGPAPRKPSNLALRLVTAALLIPPVIWVIYQGGVFVLATVVVATLLAVNEFYQLIEQKGAEPLRGYGMAAAAALPVLMYFGYESLATVLLTVALLAMMVVQLAKARISEALASISGTFFGVFYVGWLLSHAVVLRQFTQVVASRWPDVAAGMHPEFGGFLLFYTISAVIAGDVGAYFAGRAYGRRKLAPRISPGKTVEGALGALAAGTAMAIAIKAGFDFANPEVASALSWGATVVTGFALAIVGMVGDLIESLLKRDAEVKDTGTLLPGTGGILDRIDSNLIAIPVMYYAMLAYVFLTKA